MKKITFLLIAGVGFLLGSGTRAEAQYWYRPWYHRPVVVAPAPVPAYYPYSYSMACDVQIALKRRGYYRGPIDGDIGPSSRAAIRAWQYDRGLRITGYIDRPLLRSLGL